MSSNNWKTAAEQEIKALEASEVFSPTFRKKKLTAYIVRTILAVGLFYYFWESEWARWLLWFYIPLNLFGLGLIVLMPVFLRKKIEKIKAKIDGIEEGS